MADNHILFLVSQLILKISTLFLLQILAFSRLFPSLAPDFSPANAEAAQLYRDNNKEYVKRVRATVEMSWVDDSEGI